VDTVGGANHEGLCPFLLALLTIDLAFAPNESFLEGAWLEADSNWVNAPKYVTSREQWSQTAVLYFGKDHKFALMYCTVIRVPKKYMNISNGDPRGVYRGEWSIHNDTVSLTYQLVEHMGLIYDAIEYLPMHLAQLKGSRVGAPD
jgi:hypothetical protein